MRKQHFIDDGCMAGMTPKKSGQTPKMDCHPGHAVAFDEMMNYHEPGSPTSCRSLGLKAALIQERALFH
jgi:hypothetical protein